MSRSMIDSPGLRRIETISALSWRESILAAVAVLPGRTAPVGCTGLCTDRARLTRAGPRPQGDLFRDDILVYKNRNPPGSQGSQAAETEEETMRRPLTLGRREAMGFLALALGAIATRSVRPALAQQKLVLKASDVHRAGYPTVAAVESLGRKLQQASDGRLSVQMYGSMQLGGEKEAIEQAQVGAIQFARVSVGALGPGIGDLNVFNLPYLFRSTAHMQKVIDGPIGRELMDKVTNNPTAGLVAICWMDAGARSIYDTKKG